MERIASSGALQLWKKQILAQTAQTKCCLSVCNTGCAAVGALKTAEALEEEIRKRGLTETITVKRTGCHGFCEQGPIVVAYPKGLFYVRVKPEDAADIVERTAIGGEIIERLLYKDPATRQRVIQEADVPFYASQTRLLLAHNSVTDPHVLDDYVAHDGYAALAKALDAMTPEQVVGEIRDSGLRGRGGAGFLAGVKWQFCRDAAGDEKYVVCNADEGDPGAFMDRSLLEGLPYAILEGMAIAAYAIGARKGFIYVRAEYPIAVRHARHAIDKAREAGLLGDDILGSGFSFDAEVREGAGAFICGEETSLIASLEGKRGVPRSRPPFPAQQGYHNKPTNINNVETLANVPLIILRGKDWYRSIGTESSKGTKIFALAGKVNNTGLVEAPMGATLRQIIFDIGGGIPRNRKFKAVQIGGPSGGCVPEQFLDLPIDYESMKQVGAIMGSGGLIVMDDQTCAVDIARFFLDFVQKESCGKCAPCRVGTRQMLDILNRICNGQGREGDIERLEDLAHTIREGSLCGLGKTAPNPVLSTLTYFRDEYEAHVSGGWCPAGVCKHLVRVFISVETCVGCGQCVKVCPANAISGERKQAHHIDQELCITCGACYDVCKFDAVKPMPRDCSSASPAI